MIVFILGPELNYTYGLSIKQMSHVIVASHERSGTHLTIDAITHNFPCYSSTDRTVYDLTLDRLLPSHPRHIPSPRFVEELDAQPRVFKTHAHADLNAYFGADPTSLCIAQDLFSRSKVIYVCRDGRDVMTSLYHLRIAPGSKLSLNSYIRRTTSYSSQLPNAPMTIAEYWAYHIESWLPQNVFTVRYEDLLTNYEDVLKQIESFLQSPLASPTIDIRRRPQPSWLRSSLMRRLYRFFLRAIWNIKYSSIEFRHGRIGDYAQEFTPEALMNFERVAGSTLSKLGYRLDAIDEINI